MTIKTIRQGDDFKIIIALKDNNGEPLDVTTTHFKLTYKDIYDNSYVVSYDGNTRINNYVENGNLIGVFENYKLACGVLKREAWYWVADPAFTDGRWNYGDTQLSAIELTKQGETKEVEGTIEVLDGVCVNETLVVSKGDKGDKGETGETGKSAYQIAVENGYKDTEVQFGNEQATIADNSARLTAVETNKQDKPIAGRTFLTPLFVARCAIFNDKTGFYELNGLTDITEGQMMTIYNESNACFSLPNLGELYSKTKMRTNLPNNQASIGGVVVSGINCNGMFLRCDYIEVINFNGSLYPTTAIRMFDNCPRLKSIIHNNASFSIVLSNLTSASLMFNQCVELEIIKISQLISSISFSDSPKLSHESMRYIINNAGNKTPITLTLHETAKARLTEEDIALASSKNITIA